MVSVSTINNTNLSFIPSTINIFRPRSKINAPEYDTLERSIEEDHLVMFGQLRSAFNTSGFSVKGPSDMFVDATKAVTMSGVRGGV